MVTILYTYLIDGITEIQHFLGFSLIKMLVFLITKSPQDTILNNKNL